LAVKAVNTLPGYNRVMNRTVHSIAQGTVLKGHFDVNNDPEMEQFVENVSTKRSGKRMRHMARNDDFLSRSQDMGARCQKLLTGQ
jgi:hypothetical protein